MEWDSDSLDALAERLLGSRDATELARIVDDSPEVIRSDELDGRLAVRAMRATGHAEHSNRIGALRHSLELARFNGFSATPQPASYWFRWLCNPNEAFSRPPPPPIQDESAGASKLSDDERLTAEVATAVLLARSWEDRRRIFVAYDDRSRPLEELLDSLDSLPEWSGTAGPFADVVRDGRQRGWSAACADGPMLFPGERIDVDVEMRFMTMDELIQLSWLSYVESPAWHRRREIVVREAEVLLEPAHGDRLDELWPMAEAALPRVMVRRAREVLDYARSSSVDAAFAGELPPTEVIIASAINALPTATGMTRVNALRTLTHFYHPSLWPTMHARASYALGLVLLGPEGGAPSPFNVEEAAQRVWEAAVDLRGVDARGDQLAREVRTILASVQSRRVRGPRDRHVEAAIQVLTSLSGAVADYAEASQLHAEMARCLLLRVSGVEERNARLAREHASAALVGAERMGNAALTADAHTLLGAATHKFLPKGETVDRSEAVSHLEEALRLSPPGGTGAAMAHLHLGMVHAVSGPLNNAAAMRHLRAAAVYFTRERSPSRWAELQEALGNALIRGRPDDPGAWAGARSHYLLALEEYDATPALQLRCRASLAATHFRAHNWKSALKEYRLVLDIAADAAAYESTEAGRLGLVAALRNVHERMAYAQVQLGAPWDAIKSMELGRVTGLRRLYGGQLGAGTERRDLATVVRSRVGDVPIVLPLVTSAGSLAFLLTGTTGDLDLTVVPLPGLTDHDLRLVFDGGPGRRGWLFAYHDWVRADAEDDLDSDDVALRAVAEEARDEAFDQWSATIWQALADLGRLLMTPIAEALRSAGVSEGAKVRLVPSKWLSLVPLHAAPVLAGRPFMDSFRLVTLPALWLLDAGDGQRRDRPRTVVCLVADDPELGAPDEEAKAVTRGFEHAHRLRADRGGIHRLVDLLDRATHVHATCHGTYDWANPTNSGLDLSDGSRLTADTLARLPLHATELVTLSACETGLTDADRAPSEFLGLPGSLLAAGARTTLSSLWLVDDEVTAEFMALFYEALHESACPVTALAHAQSALREAGYAEPYYWAAFTLIDCR